MARLVSKIVRALADFIEFDEAVHIAERRGTLAPIQARLATAQRDTLWKRVKAAAGGDAVKILQMNYLPWSDAESELAARRSDMRALLRHRANQRAERDELIAAGAI